MQVGDKVWRIARDFSVEPGEIEWVCDDGKWGSVAKLKGVSGVDGILGEGLNEVYATEREALVVFSEYDVLDLMQSGSSMVKVRSVIPGVQRTPRWRGFFMNHANERSVLSLSRKSLSQSLSVLKFRGSPSTLPLNLMEVHEWNTTSAKLSFSPIVSKLG